MDSLKIMVISLNKSKVGQYTVYHRKDSEFVRNYDELFVRHLYNLQPTNEKVTIIDVGAHIGMSTLYIKMLCPNAKVICFEPNPYTFDILKKNIQENGLKDIILVNKALSDHVGQAILFGELDGITADTRGNSIISTWGVRANTEEITVATTKLSEYITEDIYFLKMDLEGAETIIIPEIGDKIKKINYAVIDLHAVGAQGEEELDRLVRKVEVTHAVEIVDKDVNVSIPGRWHDWLVRNKPVMKILYAQRLIE
jgi:FkbM family methyltransferase